ncbi:MAG: response regulator, partial [Bdellovibrionales bacterium]|nr:response regulator [Bdellovibrionales bacterium]
HDLNNTLGAIIGHLDLIKLAGEGNQDIEHSADLALESSERARKLIEHVSAFSDQEKSDRKVINLQQTIIETVDLLNRLLAKNIKVSSKLDRSRKLNILVNPVELRQVLMNLALNSQEAMPDGGSLFFEFDIISGAAAGKQGSDEEYVCLIVRDTGYGIQAEHLDHVFEPAFTTKDGLSLGLGLSTVYRVMQEHNGWVDIESAPGEGTSVSLFFPLQDQPQVAQNSAQIIPFKRPNLNRKGSILVIEDESVLCELVKLYLEAAGFEAITFTRPTEAIHWFQSNADKVDLVLLDMIMPELSGKKCFEKLQAINPDIPIALCSGFLDKDVQSLLAAGAVKFFQKPGRYPLMVTWIAEALRKE